MGSFFTGYLAPSKLLFYFLFHGLHLALFAVGWYLQETSKKLTLLNLLNFSVWISRGAGLALSVDGTLILLPMCRTLLRIPTRCSSGQLFMLAATMSTSSTWRRPKSVQT
ncbi:hypothetical protein DTO195F2_5353 [Paecilomyces variotii]|nr:hypothetical protein DTO195F2_5353 [Paecilomyces variotii]